MSLEFVKRWNFRWRRDYWYRQKFKVAFNSLVHRAMTPLDVAFEYAEQAFVEQQVKELEVEEKRKKDLKIHGLFTPRAMSICGTR